MMLFANNVLINYNDVVITVEKKAIRHAYMRVKPDGSVAMTVNKKLSLSQIENIIHKSILRLKPKIETIKASNQERLNEKNVAYYLGHKYIVSVVYGHNKKEVVILNNHIMLKVTESTELDTTAIEKILNNWYKKEAVKVFHSRFLHWLNKIKSWSVLDPTLTIRGMKSRFGSYAKQQHKVTLNLWLIKAPLSLLDYVIAHELSHIKHFNHSKHFYDELSKLYPNWQECRQELNRIARIYCNEHSFL